MAETRRKLGWIGRLLGLAVVIVAVISVFFIDWKKEVPEEPPLIRPLKTMVIESPFASQERKLPGRVLADRRVDLSFEVPGVVIEKLIKKGDTVEEGQLLARLDPQDYQYDLDSARAEMERALAHRDRIRVAVEKDAVAKQALSDAEAAFDIAEAKVRTRQKALNDTYLRARFPGVIADTFVENFENVQAQQPVLSLQDFSSVEIEVNVPESYVAFARRDNATVPRKERAERYFASFDYLPDRKFEVTLKEFATEADPKTQTYAATFRMPAPDDINILPGMTSTIHVRLRPSRDGEETGYIIPVDAVPLDGLGNQYLWLVKKSSGDIHTVHRVDIEVGEMTEDSVQVLKGIETGDRIAVAGVHFLQEGQKVRLLSPRAENTGQ